MSTVDTRRGRGGRPWRRVAARVYGEERVCWLCGRVVDQGLSARHREARTADHLVQLCHGGHPTDRANLRLAHNACNAGRSNRLRGVGRAECACARGMPCARVPMAHAVVCDPLTV